MAEQIETLFDFWTQVGRMKRRWCGLMSNYFDHLLLLGRTAVLSRCAYCYRRNSVVCLSVCLSECPSRSWAPQKRLNRSSVIWGVYSGGPKEPCIKWGSRSFHGKRQFWGKSGPL